MQPIQLSQTNCTGFTVKPAMEGRENKTGKGVANEYVIGARNGFLVKAGVDYKDLTRTCQHHQKEITFYVTGGTRQKMYR